MKKLPNLVAFLLLAILLFFNTNFCFSQTFEMNKNCKLAYQNIMQLKVEPAKKILKQEEAENPQNVAVHLLYNYIDFFEIFINENYDYYLKNEHKKDLRLSAINKLDDNNAFKNYAKAEILTHWSLARIKFKLYFKSILEARKAFKLIKTNQTKFPDFKLNLKTLGFYHSLIGTIPDSYKFFVQLIGFTGKVETGMNELKIFNEYAKNNNLFYEEGKLIHLFLENYFYKNKANTIEKANNILTDENSLLQSFLKANLAYKNNNATLAIKSLTDKPNTAEYQKFYYADYFLGINKLNALDENANIYFENFIHNATNIHYKKDVWQKMAWYNLIVKNDTSAYFNAIKNCLTVGENLVDADKQALNEAKKNELPNVYLLKIRLLIDGGFFEKATAIIETNKHLFNKQELLESKYRIGKMFLHQNKMEQAIENFENVINFEIDANNFYFKPKSCLYLGEIFEQQNNIENALFYYKKVFTYNSYSYQNSIEQQAKAALNRLQNL